MNDIMHPVIALMFDASELECPICGLAATAHRFVGIGAGKGSRWLTFLPHLAPCRRPCAAGYIRPRKSEEVHTGPRGCRFCDGGCDEAPGDDLILIDETGDLEDIEVEWRDDGSEAGTRLDALLRTRGQT